MFLWLVRQIELTSQREADSPMLVLNWAAESLISGCQVEQREIIEVGPWSLYHLEMYIFFIANSS